MKKTYHFPMVLLGCIATQISLSSQKSTLPNILIIYADDLGYGDTQCYNHQGKIPTPNIDHLASQGMQFTDAHSSCSISSPSRYTLLTGRYHWRSKLQKGNVGMWDSPLITYDRMTIAGMVKTKGYSTYAVGKWHLGWNWPFATDQKSHFTGFSGFEGKSNKIIMKTEASDEDKEIWAQVFSKPITGGPVEVGFDYYFGTDVPNWPPFCFIENDHTLGIPTELLDPELITYKMASYQGPALKDWDLKNILPTFSNKVISIIEEEGKSESPFLIYLPLPSPHEPIAVNENWNGKSGLNNKYSDYVTQTDHEIGRILKALEDNNLYRNTIVIFTSDNGSNKVGAEELKAQGHFVNGDLRGYKGDFWEGGHRIPFIIRYPGVTKAGSKSNLLVHQVDIMATIADILDIDMPKNIGEDSYSLFKILKGSNKPPRKYAISTSGNGIQTIRKDSWKLICTEVPQLYNLAEDIGESKNIASEFPKKILKMLKVREAIILKGRSTRGTVQKNDVEVIR